MKMMMLLSVSLSVAVAVVVHILITIKIDRNVIVSSFSVTQSADEKNIGRRSGVKNIGRKIESYHLITI